MQIMEDIVRKSSRQNEGHFLNPHNHQNNRLMLAVPARGNRRESSHLRKKSLTPAILDTI